MPVAFKDYYATLGVPRTATDEDIKRGFRRLARQFHPDVAGDKQGGEERFKEINEAYEVLGNAENRRQYDQLGTSWKAGADFRPPPEWRARDGRARGSRRPGGDDEDEFHFGGTGFSDFFESLFGGRGRSGGREPRENHVAQGPGSRDGDVEGEILVALDEVLHGSLRTINYERVSSRTGRISKSGFQVRIPTGVREGQLIRVADRGQPGPNGVPGDLYLRVRLAKHPELRVRELDLWTEIPLAPWEAVLGATIHVPSLEGPLSVKVPAGSRNGQHLRARGRGLPGGDGARGDLYVVVNIEVPTTVDPEERVHWERLAEASRFQPRTGK